MEDEPREYYLLVNKQSLDWEISMQFLTRKEAEKLHESLKPTSLKLFECFVSKDNT